MAAPKPHLRTLHLDVKSDNDFLWNDDGSELRKVMGLITEGTYNSVETFYFGAARAHPGTFDKFVEKNHSSISSVCITLEDWESDMENQAYYCLEPFFNLPNLKDIDLGIPYPKNMLKHLNNQGVMCLEAEQGVCYVPQADF